MSRQILTARDHSGRDTLKADMLQGKLILSRYQGQPLAMLYQNGRLLEVQSFRDSDSRPDSHAEIGSIYIGKVKNVVKNLDACFVEISGGQIVYLPMSEAACPYLLNRRYDGRLLQGDELPVQITREPVKTKLASVTANISVGNEYFVLTMGSTRVGISHKLSSEQAEELRRRLTEAEILEKDGSVCQVQNVPSFGIVVRTRASELLFGPDCAPDSAVDSGTGAKKGIKTVFEALLEEFEDIFKNARHRSCFSCLREPDAPAVAVLKHFSASEYEEILTDDETFYAQLLAAPKLPKPLRLYADEGFSLWKLYGLETKLNVALEKRVWLSSGANLIIEQTECLTTIDVNSAKSGQGQNAEEGLLHINLEAAKEAAAQLRLRNLSGIIIVDFINMSSKEAVDTLLQSLREYVRKDSVPVRVVDMTPLGLVEITRKKVMKSLKEQLGTWKD